MDAPLDRAKLLAARYAAAEARPYLASALYALTVVPSPGPSGVRTMGVDRHWRCYVAPEFVARTPVPELSGVWIHEVAHLLRDHHGRADRLPPADQRDPVRINIAQDCEINDDLLADGLVLPAGRMEPGLFGLPKGGMFEGYLPGIPPTPPHAVDCGSGAHGGPAPWELGGCGGDGTAGIGPVEAEALRRQTAQAVRAHLRARGRGSVPAGWERWAEQVLEPAVDWRRALSGAVREAAAWAAGAVDYTYRRPSRRTPALGGRVVLPSLRRPLPRVAVVIDTSGSMGDAELAAALAEVTGVLREVGVGGNRVTVLACDADVHAVSRVASAGEVTLAGGGGTDMRVGIAAALARPDRPSIVVVLTDGITPWPEESPSCRLIAALIGEGAPNPPGWVETVRLDPADLGRRPDR
ncbi:VWA-like domain-containing protein [Streptomyces katrae]|uniref:VWA-like domain-containing protein n=1 Tax=Streptomyces katrae TaxID=68223 RepID=A0ABT7GKY8_9ACTN|nr:VWA-like domain-containing protein [Streptomyces katrae]MDK9494229.1 VWA-like domain-containing protein [Streptomyces katrae]